MEHRRLRGRYDVGGAPGIDPFHPEGRRQYKIETSDRLAVLVAAMIGSIVKGQATAADSEQIRNGEHLLAIGRALAALLASHAATGEVLALYAVAHGTSSTFLYVGTLVALASVGAAILLFAVTRIGQPPRS